MVAGVSSRFQGRIKSFAQITENETLIEYSLNQALKNSFDKIIFIVGEKTEQPFKEKFGDSYKGIPVYYALQYFDTRLRDRPWGTVDALCSAKNLLSDPFVGCSGDDIYGKNSFKILFNHLKNKKTNATLGYKLKEVLSNKGGVNRGVFKIDSNNQDKSITEEFNITGDNLEEKGLMEESLCSMLFFALQPKVVSILDDILINFKEKHNNDRKIECLLPNEIGKLIENRKIIMDAYITNDKWLGITNPEDEIAVREQLRNSS